MSREIARVLIDQKLEELRKLPYGQLVALLDRSSAVCLLGPDGQEYQMETQAFWDRGPAAGDIRVMVAVDGGDVSAFRPLVGDFIIARDGTFVGEESNTTG